MKAKRLVKRAKTVTNAGSAAGSAGAGREAQPWRDEEPGKLVEHQEPFEADKDERLVEDSPETDMAPDRLDRESPEKRISPPEVCGFAEEEAVPASELDGSP